MSDFLNGDNHQNLPAGRSPVKLQLSIIISPIRKTRLPPVHRARRKPQGPTANQPPATQQTRVSSPSTRARRENPEVENQDATQVTIPGNRFAGGGVLRRGVCRVDRESGESKEAQARPFCGVGSIENGLRAPSAAKSFYCCPWAVRSRIASASCRPDRRIA
jgi:hypothetical protein